ncbi:MAG: glycan-binding surface protein [Prevotella sp.]|nr:glycan-binding surface protein [Prevotella sp.]
MNIINKFKKGLFLTVAALMGMSVFTSCEDEPDKYEVAGGKPTINYIRCLSSEVKGNNDAEDTHYTNGELVTSATPQSTLCLVGENLRSVYEMYFNDKKAVLNNSYITDNTLIVDVPKEVPGLVTNKIYMITESKDTVAYDFQVIISAPEISSMSNEYAEPGSKVTLNGKYIIDDPGTPLQIVFEDANGNPTLVDHSTMNIASDFTSVTFTIPENAAEGSIKVSSIYGESVTSFHYRDSRGLLFDFDGVTGLGNHGWHARDIKSDEFSITGNYVQLGDGSAIMSEDGGWDDGNFSFEYWPGNWEDPETFTAADGYRLTDLADFSNWENMSLKFEMYVPKESPWSAGAMQVIFAGVDKISYGSAGISDAYGNTLGGCNNTYFRTKADGGYDLPRALYRPWTETGSYDTGGEWVTVSLPIKSTFTYNFDGTSVNPSFSKEDFTSLTIFVVGGGVNGTECTPIIKIDNIRVVPNK